MTVEVTRTGDGLRFARLDPFFVELLRQVPLAADPGDAIAARNRLYPLLTEEPHSARANEEWRAYIHPELEQHFATAAQIVRTDLHTFTQTSNEPDLWSFEIPIAHFDEWLNVLNQSRLTLATRFNFLDADLNRPGPPAIETVRDLSLFQIHFYAFIQECLLQDI